MKLETPKTIDALIKYLSEEKNLDINKDLHKLKLMNMGYYHGYKGCRYMGQPSNTIPYTKFDEFDAVYLFDTSLKTLFYPKVMAIETAQKNYVLEVMISRVNSASFLDIYNNLLDNYKLYSTSGKSFPDPKKRKSAEDKYKKELKRRLDLFNRIHKIQTDAYYSDNKIVSHYLQKDVALPIWAIFELISLGEFGHFVSCLNKDCRFNISREFSIRQSDDTNAMLPQRLIYATKDLRNAIAHNEVIFDTRFKRAKIDKQVSSSIENALSVNSLSFETITDYLILLVYQLNLFKFETSEIICFIENYERITEQLYRSVPINIFNKIVHTDSNTKIVELKKFFKF